jgi:hypothetical protein
MTGCEASDLPVESHATIDSPVPRDPCVDDDHVTVTVSPFGSEAREDRATFAPKSLRVGSYAAVCDDKAPGDTISISGGSFPSGAVTVVVVAGALVVVVVDVARAVVVGATVVVVVDVVVRPGSTVVVDAPVSTPPVLVVAVSAAPNEHPAATSAKAATTSFHISIIT